MQTTLTPEESEMFKALVVDYHAAWSPGHEPFNISNAERYYSKDDELTAYDVMHTDGVIKGWKKYKVELIKIMQGFADFNISLNKNDVESSGMVRLFGQLLTSGLKGCLKWSAS
jgi:hypothetical protein